MTAPAKTKIINGRTYKYCGNHGDPGKVDRLGRVALAVRAAVRSMDGANGEMDKVEVTFKGESLERLEKVRIAAGLDSHLEAVRDALRLYEYVVERHGEGDRFYVRSKDGAEVKIKLIGSSSTNPEDEQGR